MPKRIDMTKWLEKYKRGTSAGATDWYTAYLATPGIAAAASSDAAQASYEAKMRDASILALRKKKLERLSDEDFKAPVRKGGAALYSSGTTAKADKAQKGFAPYAPVIDAAVAALPARAATGRENLMNRALPIVEALEKKKKEG